MAATLTAFYIVIASRSTPSLQTLLLLLHSVGESLPFTYTGTTGPDKWAWLNRNNSMCANGKSQSPINIVTAQAVRDNNLKPLIRSYNPTNVSLIDKKFYVEVLYPEHSLELIVDEKVYYLEQMHWHAPSEHRIDGQRYAAELHLVHKADDGNVSVVAILFEYGRPDPLLAKIQNKLSELSYEVKHHEEKSIAIGSFHPTEVRKRCHKYYRYVGSFTTPPCDQSVIWNIPAKVRSISRRQVEALKTPLDMRCKNNARPCQPMNGRHVALHNEDPTARRHV